MFGRRGDCKQLFDGKGRQISGPWLAFSGFLLLLLLLLMILFKRVQKGSGA